MSIRNYNIIASAISEPDCSVEIKKYLYNPQLHGYQQLGTITLNVGHGILAATRSSGYLCYENNYIIPIETGGVLIQPKSFSNYASTKVDAEGESFQTLAKLPGVILAGNAPGGGGGRNYIHKSTDGGLTWSQLAVDFGAPYSNIVLGVVGRVLIVPMANISTIAKYTEDGTNLADFTLPETTPISAWQTNGRCFIRFNSGNVYESTNLIDFYILPTVSSGETVYAKETGDYYTFDSTLSRFYFYNRSNGSKSTTYDILPGYPAYIKSTNSFVSSAPNSVRVFSGLNASVLLLGHYGSNTDVVAMTDVYQEDDTAFIFNATLEASIKYIKLSSYKVEESMK